MINLIHPSGLKQKQAEIMIPLNSGDQYDQVLELDQTYPIILARGDYDDFDSYHSAVGYANITISEAS
ncbi:MAG: hypothetical protein P9L97_07610 [Candidatus Tenebribacter davisii]|jgi:hypothetical protein|nr:hypothetical protein [Candidatus Tenebribacter davisii]